MMGSSWDRYLTVSVRIMPTNLQSDAVLDADTDERAELSRDLDAQAFSGDKREGLGFNVLAQTVGRRKNCENPEPLTCCALYRWPKWQMANGLTRHINKQTIGNHTGLWPKLLKWEVWPCHTAVWQPTKD